MGRLNRIAALLLGLALVIAACGDDGADPVFTTTTSSSTTAGDTTSSTVAATTTEATTTTTSSSTTTTTTTTSTTTTTTTTMPPPPPIIFEPDGIGIAQFGDDPGIVLAQLLTVFGPSSFDSGWIAGGFTDYGVCPGTSFRRVEFDGGDFVVHFADGDHFGPDGTRVFYYYGYFGGAPGPTPGPPASIDAGTSVNDLTTVWPTAQVFDDDPFFGYTYRVDGAGWNQLWGRLTGTDGTDQIISVTGGLGCGE